MSTETTHAGTAQAVLEVDLGAIAANWRLLCGLHPSGPVAGVIKADAYGLGAVPVARALYEAGCRHFFVAYLQEALAVRDAVPEAVVAVLSGPIAGSEADYLAHGITPVLGSLEEIARWRSLRTRASSPHVMAGLGPATHDFDGICDDEVVDGRTRPGHDVESNKDADHSVILHIDTGMSRLGLSAAECAVLAAEPERLAGLDLLYVMTHLVSAELPSDPANQRQRQDFDAACAALPAARRSLANSSGIFLGPAFGSDLARPGAALYGINPTPDRSNPMRPVVRLLARVLSVRDVPTGTSVGYNATWTAARDSRIATAAVGYADGYHRSLSGQAMACFDGSPVPLVGRISMDLTTFDVTDHPAVHPGAWLELLGSALTADAVAQAAGTNGYEILTSLGRRFERVYRKA